LHKKFAFLKQNNEEQFIKCIYYFELYIEKFQKNVVLLILLYTYVLRKYTYNEIVRDGLNCSNVEPNQTQNERKSNQMIYHLGVFEI
jgi:hypothetical protein